MPPVAPAHASPANLIEESGDGGGTGPPVVDWRDPATHELLVESVRPHCPWPPHPASWRALDEPCEAALDRFYLTDQWRSVLADAVETRRAVAAALDDPDCRPHDADARRTSWSEWPRWDGEPRLELREACAADAMVRLAKLQHMCVLRLRLDERGIGEVDRHDASILEVDDLGAEHAWDQETYYRRMAAHHSIVAGSYWADYKCRSLPATAFDWLDQLPEPPKDQVRSFAHPSASTQALHLYDAARRLGAEVPTWTLPRD